MNKIFLNEPTLMDTIQGKEWGIASSPLMILSPLLGFGGIAGFPHS